MSSEKLSSEQIETENIKDDIAGGKTTTCKGDYRIAICKDGKYAVTFDIGKCCCR